MEADGTPSFSAAIKITIAYIEALITERRKRFTFSSKFNRSKVFFKIPWTALTIRIPTKRIIPARSTRQKSTFKLGVRVFNVSKNQLNSRLGWPDICHTSPSCSFNIVIISNIFFISQWAGIRLCAPNSLFYPLLFLREQQISVILIISLTIIFL